MAHRRKKKRTHVRPQPASSTTKANGQRTPKSMVIRVGASEVGPHVSQLVQDVRLMMEPDTAGRLKERKSNRLRDYTTMAGPLGVTHLMLFSRSKETGNVNLRLALTPRGPTLHFKVENYSLCKDVGKSVKSASGAASKSGNLHTKAPLLVMNNFTTSGAATTAGDDSGGKPKPKGKDRDRETEILKQLESLATSVFQSLFPPIAPHSTPLSSIRRIILLNRELKSDKGGEDVGTYTINLRHYAITTKKVGLSKRIRRLNPTRHEMNDKKKNGVPNLGRLDDMADYLLDPAAGRYTSDSETEVETDVEVEVMETETTRKVLSRKALERMRDKEGEGMSSLSAGGRNVEKRAVKLVELGPRMRLRMTKVEEGLCDGKVMWHEFVKKTDTEIKNMDNVWDHRRKEKEARKKEQRENVERKKKEKAKSSEGENAEEGIEEEWHSDDFEDIEDDEVKGDVNVDNVVVSDAG